jgi:acetamidase/formamidase
MALIPSPNDFRADVPPKQLHTLRARADNVHWGYFDASLRPALTIDSGDIVYAEAVTHHAGDAPDLMMDDALHALWRAIPESDRNPGVHIMTGPIHVKGAQPGDMLEVRYLSMTPRCRYGSNLAANWGYLYKEMGEKERVTIYELDAAAQYASALYAYDFAGKYLTPGTITDCAVCDRQSALPGIRVPARPHLGTAGVAPAVNGRVSTIPPGRHGGNIDNWRIGAGATMYYPVQVEGGLFSVGDPHISQGDGEVSGTAIESSLNVAMQIILRKDFHFPAPLLETPDCWIVHGFGDQLDHALRGATLDTMTLLEEHLGLSRNDAYSLISVAGDVGITQVVDSTLGAHVRIPRGIFPPRQG